MNTLASNLSDSQDAAANTATTPGWHIATYDKPGMAETFPLDAFPPFLREMAEEMALLYQTPVCLPAMSALAILSGAVGKSVQVSGAYKDKPTFLNLYIVAIAERGSGKGNIGERLSAAISQRSIELAKQQSQATAGKRGELGVIRKKIQRMENAPPKDEPGGNIIDLLTGLHVDAEKLESEVSRRRTLITSDTTGESLARDLADGDESIFSFSTEAGGALKVAFGKYAEQSGGDIELLLSGYSLDSFRQRRITRKDIELAGPCVSLLWFIQPSVAETLMENSEAYERGLTARMLLFESGARREFDSRENRQFTRRETWEVQVNALLDRRLDSQSPVPAIIRCTPEARDAFADFHDESVKLERGPYADAIGELSRWRENSIKIAGLFALAAGAPLISTELAVSACRVVRWAGLNYLSMLRNGRDEKSRKEFQRLEKILIAVGGQMSVGDLAASHGIKRIRLDAIVAAFPQLVAIERREHAGAGRPAEIAKLISKSS